MTLTMMLMMMLVILVIILIVMLWKLGIRFKRPYPCQTRKIGTPIFVGNPGLFAQSSPNLFLHDCGGRGRGADGDGGDDDVADDNELCFEC